MKPREPITCGIVDDDPQAIQQLSLLIETEPRLELVFTETDSLRAIKYLRQNPVQLLFLDGVMPGIDGIGLAGALIPQPKIIMITAYDKLAMPAFQVGIADCISKPVDMQRFTLAVYRAVGDRWGTPSVAKALDHVFVKLLGEPVWVKVYFEDIVYIESERNNLKIRLPADEIVTRRPLKEIAEKLPEDFMQVHRGYVVPISKVRRFGKRYKWLKITGSDKEISVGAEYLKAFKERVSP